MKRPILIITLALVSLFSAACATSPEPVYINQVRIEQTDLSIMTQEELDLLSERLGAYEITIDELKEL
jgi:hypothetical protein